MAAILGSGLTLGVDPLGGAATPYWEPINSIYKLDIAVVSPVMGGRLRGPCVFADRRVDPAQLLFLRACVFMTHIATSGSGE